MIQKQKIALFTAGVYSLIMAIGMWVLRHISGLVYTNPHMVNTLIYFEIVMAILAVWGYRHYFPGALFRLFRSRISHKKIGLLFFFVIGVMYINLIMMTLSLVITGYVEPKEWGFILTILLTTIIVAISEETMFRGVLLSAFCEKHSKFVSILLSSIIFSIFHSINIIGGMPLFGAIQQMVLTFFAGITFACLVVRFNSLIPVIIFHALWDFSLMAGQYIGADIEMFAFFNILFEILSSLIMLFWIKSHQNN